MDRGTCWSLTINNPTDADINVTLPAKWTMTGQIEQGKEGTVHYQGMLTTPQIRFSAVKKLFPRAHIELAKNKVALEKYVSKSETRIQSLPDRVSNIPTLFDYQHTIALRWDDIEFSQFQERYDDNEIVKKGMGEIALEYVDKLVAEDIEKGVCGIEYIAINPMWRSAWKKFYKSMIARERFAVINSSDQSIKDGIQTENEETGCEEVRQEVCEEGTACE